jgi:hypothetical protein
LGTFHYKYGILDETRSLVSKPAKEKSSPSYHHDDLSYFGGMNFLGFVVINDVMTKPSGKLRPMCI